MVGRPLPVVERSAEPEHPHQPIVRHAGRPDDLGRPALRHPPIHLHVPQAILRDDVALGDKKVVGVLRVDVRHTPLVAKHFDVGGEAGISSVPSIVDNDCFASDSNVRVPAAAVERCSAPPQPPATTRRSLSSPR